MRSSASKISRYWLCQLSGWFLACLYWIDGMRTCECISLANGTINILLTFSTGILITHLHVLVIRKYKLHQEDFPKVIYYILLFVVLISIALWFVNVFINFYTYKEHYYLRESKFDNLLNFAKGSFDMFIVFSRIASTWVLAYFLYHLGRRSNIAEKEKLEVSQLLTESSLNHLKEQLNPHFMFNSLNSVKALISENPEKAETAIVVLADIPRNSLNSASKPKISFRAELEHCKDYLEMEKIRFEDRLQYKFIIQEGIASCTLPPLSIQTLVENAIKHGLNKSIAGVNITVDCRLEKNGVVTTVTNNGKLKTSNSIGIGIENLKKRFEILYYQNFKFTISENNGNVIAQFKLPKEEIL